MSKAFDGWLRGVLGSQAAFEAIPIPDRCAPEAASAAGRACSDGAMRALGVRAPPRPRPGRGRPLWPSGLTGSITHGGGLACAVAARAEAIADLGVDIEYIDRVSEDVVPHVCRADELAMISALPRMRAPLWAAITFSAKEAVYKALSWAGPARLDFHDVALQIDLELSDRGRFTLLDCRAAARNAAEALAIEGYWWSDGIRVATLAVLRANIAGPGLAYPERRIGA